MSRVLDLAEVEQWIGSAVGPVGKLEVRKQRPWATVLRATVGRDVVWFKACAPVQAFEPRLTAELARRWPERVGTVLACDEDRSWLLTADAGEAIGNLGNAPDLRLASRRSAMSSPRRCRSTRSSTTTST